MNAFELTFSRIEDLPQGGRICVYGAGGRGREVVGIIEKHRPDVRVVAYLDTYKDGEFDGRRVVNLNQIESIVAQCDLILVASLYWGQISRELKIRGIENFSVALFPEPEQNVQEVLVVDECKLVYVLMPKVASSSIRHAICNALESSSVKLDPHATKLIDLGDEQYRDYYKFSFVRNPWDRVVSCYRDKLCRTPVELDDSDKLCSPVLGLLGSAEVSFKDFATYLAVEPEALADLHWRSQYLSIYDAADRCLVDYVGRFENLSEDFNEICRTVGLNAELPHRNRTERKRYTDYYDEGSRTAVANRYQTDISRFDYNY